MTDFNPLGLTQMPIFAGEVFLLGVFAWAFLRISDKNLASGFIGEHFNFASVSPVIVHLLVGAGYENEYL